MKTTKKFLLILLAVTLMFTVLPVVALAAGADDPAACQVDGESMSFNQALAKAADGFATIVLQQDVTMSSLSFTGTGYYGGAGVIELNGKTLTITGGMSIGDNVSYLYFYGPGTVKMGSFTATGQQAHGLYFARGVNATVIGNVSAPNIPNNVGITLIQASGTGTNVTVNGNVSIGGNGFGVHAVWTKDEASITVKGSVSNSCAKFGYGVYAEGGKIVVGGNVMASGVQTYATRAENGGIVLVGGSVTQSGNDGIAVWSYSNATIHVDGNVAKSGGGGDGVLATYVGSVFVKGNVTTDVLSMGVRCSQGFVEVGGNVNAGLVAIQSTGSVIWVKGTISGTVYFVPAPQKLLISRSPSDDPKYTYMYKHAIDSSKVYEQLKNSNTAKIDLSKASVTIADAVWTGKQIKPTKFTYNGKAYSISANAASVKYGKNKDIGKGTITLTGKGDFTGTKTITFKIVPKKSSVSKIAVAKKQMKVTWKKVTAAQKITKYEVRFRVKGAAKWKTKAYAASASSATIKSLTKGKVYQVQVRSYKTVSGKKYYSAWSATKVSGKIK